MRRICSQGLVSLAYHCCSAGVGRKELKSSEMMNQANVVDVVRFYDLPCSADEESGNHFDIAPGDGATPGCRAQAIRSYKVL